MVQSREKFTVGALVSLGGKSVGRALHFAVQVLLGRLLGPAGYGLYGICWTILRMSNVFTVAGLDQAILKFGVRSNASEPPAFWGFAELCLLWPLLAGAALGAALAVGSQWVAVELFHKPQLATPLSWFAPAFVFAGATRVAAAGTRVSHDVRYSIAAEEIAQPAALLLGLLLGAGWLDALRRASAITSISFVVAFALALYFLLRLYPYAGADRTERHTGIRTIVTFAVPASLGASLTMYTIWSNRILLGYLGSASDVGIFIAASQLSMLFTICLSSVAYVFTPLVASQWAEGDVDGIQSTFSLATTWSVYLSLPVLLTLVLWAPEVLRVSYGVDFAAGTAALVVLAVGQFLNAVSGPVAQVLIMTGKERLWLALSTACILTDLALMFILVPRHGLMGAAIAESASVGGLYVVGAAAVARRFGLTIYSRGLIRPAAAALVAGALMWLVRALVHGPVLVRLLVGVGTGGVAFYALTLIGGLGEEERRMLARLLRRTGLAGGGGGEGS